MRVTNRAIALILVVCTVCAAAPKHSKAHKPVGRRVLPIALVLNGTRLPLDPPPVNYGGRLLVPVRRILNALGLDSSFEGKRVVTHVGANTVEVTGGVEIRNTLYAPLRFFADALGAQAVYNRQTNSVEIVSTLVGRSGNGIVAEGGGITESGTLAAIDADSNPATLTITHNASVRTLQLRSDAAVIVQDVIAGTSNAGVLADVHVGDYAEVRLDRDGRVKQVIDAYGSRTGRVAGSGSGAIVLDDGHVVVPGRATTITLNGETAALDRIAVGDTVLVRYNIDSSEVRDIAATRASSGAPPQTGGVHITSLTFEPQRPLKAGDVISVTLTGTPGGGVAHYDIGPYVRNLGLRETQPGIYTGTYTVRRGINFANAPLFGRLRIGDAGAPQVTSSATVSVATEPPGIVDFAPDNGDTVNNSRAAIYATFSPGTLGINLSSARIVVNGHDVTSSSVRSARFIEYIPGVDLAAGPVRVTVEVADTAGNRAARSWTFTVKR